MKRLLPVDAVARVKFPARMIRGPLLQESTVGKDLLHYEPGNPHSSLRGR